MFRFSLALTVSIILFAFLNQIAANGDIVLILSGIRVPTWIAATIGACTSVGIIAKTVAFFLGVTLPAGVLAAILFAGSIAG